MATVTVGERMDLHHSMVETRSRFQWCERTVICPEACVIEQVTQSGGDLPRIDADSFLAEPERTAPTPYVAEKATMKLACEPLCENVGTTFPKV